MQQAIRSSNARVNEFTVAPQVHPKEEELPYHEWFIEFETAPSNIKVFKKALDQTLQEQNSYYFDLIKGNILQPLKITALQPGAFRKYMQSKGKLGGQNKVVRLSNDRKIAEGLQAYKL